MAKDDPIRAIRNGLDRLARAASGSPLADHVSAEAAIIETALRELESTVKALRLDHPYPLRSVLSILAEAAEHLLRDHDCDALGHETRKYAARSAREILALLEPPPDEEVRRCTTCGFVFRGETDCPRCDLFGVYPGRRDDE